MADCSVCDELHPRGSAECPGRRIGMTVAGKYRLERILGIGGMAAVYDAQHVALQRPVAVKILHTTHTAEAELAQRFVREARQQAALDHPAIVTVHDAGVDDEGFCWMEMERLNGQDLYGLVHGKERLAIERVVSIAGQLLDGLAFLHARGIVHRDLKSSNVFLAITPKGEQLKLLDFGLAKIPDGHALTMAGTKIGTILYMAPEQLHDAREVDGRADLYSTAVVMFEMLTGNWPVGDATGKELRVRVLSGQLERHPRAVRADVPEWLDAVVARAMAHKREERFASAAEMKRAITEGAAAAASWLGRLFGKRG